MSRDVYVEDILRRTDIRWIKDGQGGYVATVNGEKLRLFKWVNNVSLTRSLRDDEIVISQSTIHIALSEVGKFLRGVTLLFLGSAWPRMPETPKEMEDERLRIALDKLYLRIAGEPET